MEPVPETERMEEFRPSPIPLLRVQATSLYNIQEFEKPPTIRRCTEPTPQSPRSPVSASPSLPYRPRNISPFSRGHLRSKSSTSPRAPPMIRAQSMPGFNGAGHLLSSPIQRPASPMGSPSRVRMPRKPADEVFPGLPTRSLRNITELGGLSEEHTPRAMERSSSPVLGLPTNASFTRSRRPSSPLRFGSHSSSASMSSTTSSVTSSPSYPSYGFPTSGNYSALMSYPGPFTSSSVPSTPTSARSRSPSISSLETIPDSPDAEAAALEAENIAQLKAAADAADGGDDARSRLTLDTSGSRGRTLGIRDKRKRWSVCGAERRGDLNLDTIWED